MTQEQFYHSRAWKRLSRAFLSSKNYICEVCGNPADLAHHVKHITLSNIGNPEITLNAANLQVVCIMCHNTIHYVSSGAIVKELEFDENGGLIKWGNQYDIQTNCAGVRGHKQANACP
ncbi:MAG: HNH endonuclease [Clostridiales bacterium]|jgi:5-methylcytosine-specific restriction endonuclease McrA|nr:HNH endonuclease [Clostridiales bacterium]